MSNMLEGNCPQPKPLDELEQNDYAIEMAKAMGITQCSYSSKFKQVDTKSGPEVKASAEGKVGWGGASGKVSTEYKGKVDKLDTTNDVSAIGCETLNMMSEKMRNATNTISCMLSKSSKTQEVSLNAGQYVRFTAIKGGKLLIDCTDSSGGALLIKQNITLKVVVLNEMTQDEKNLIVDTIADSIDETIEMIKTNELGVGAADQGSKIFGDKLKDITKDSYKSTAQENIEKFQVNINAEQGIEFVADGGVIVGDNFYPTILELKGNQCTFDQNMAIDLMAQNLVKNTFVNTFKNIFTTDTKTETKIKESTKAKGMDDIKTTLDRSGDSGGWKWWHIFLLVIGILSVLGGIGYYIYKQQQKKKKKTIKAQSKLDE